MDNEYVDPRTFMVQCENTAEPRVCVRSSFTNSIIEPGGSGLIDRNSRNITYHNQISTVKKELPPQVIGLENLEQELAPLQRKPSAKFKQINHKKHSCTDVHCLIIFMCFIVAWAYIAGYAFSQGNLNNALMPTDSLNTKCGIDSGYRDRKKLFFFNLNTCLDPMTPLTGCGAKQICVKSCPQETFVWSENMKLRNDLNALKEKLICDVNIDKEKFKSINEIELAINNNSCSGWYLKSISFFNHCVWDFSENVCDILPTMLTGRTRRSNELPPENFIVLTDLQNKLEKFINNTKSLCSQNSTAMNELKEKIVESNSNVNRIIAAIVSKFNYNDSENENFAKNVAHDLKRSWKIIIFAFILHILIVLLFITLLRWLAAPLLWISIFGVILGLSVSFVYSFEQYRYWKSEPHVKNHAINLKAHFQNVFQDSNTWLYTTIVQGGILTIVVLIVFVIRKRIKIAVAIIKEASKAIMQIKSSIFFPIFPGILYIIVTIISLIIMLHLNSIGEFSFIMIRRNASSTSISSTEQCICNGPENKTYTIGDSCQPELFEKYCHLKDDIEKPCVNTSCSFKEIVKTQKTQWFMLFNILGFLWVTFFLSAYEDMVLACTFSLWYWTFDKRNLPKLPLLKSIWITTVYHLGTLAFGSLILTICRMIRYILELIERKLKLKSNVITRAILKCMKCLYWLLENFLRFLNRNAYITCAIHSTSFCQSSRKAFNLITQNVIRVYAVDRVSSFLFFLSKLLVTGCTSYITYIILKKYPKIADIHYALVPVILVAIVSYVMAHFIFSTYGMAVDTLFFCFLEDSVENDGSAEKPFYMSKELKKLLGKSKRKRKQSKK
ncbi:choline transporter-like 2 [Cochliomyia hominivorax]